MNSNFWYGLAAVGVACLVTVMIRWLPFVVLKEGKLPPAIEFLGKRMPESVMVVLIIFCLRSVDITGWPYGLPEFISCLVCAICQLKLKNFIPSILISTLLYIALSRYVF